MDAAVYLRHLQPSATSSSRTQGQSSDSGPAPVDQQPGGDEQYIQTFYCRALYDYQTDDASSLSFRRGDIIEVLTRLESGWWDGLLGDERGWFPSNYVNVISDQEAEAAFGASDYEVTQSSAGDDSAAVDIAHSLGQTLTQSNYDGDWPEAEPEAGRIGSVANGRSRSGTQAQDFWVPRVSADGRVSQDCFLSLTSTSSLPHRSSMSTLRRASIPRTCLQKATTTLMANLLSGCDNPVLDLDPVLLTASPTMQGLAYLNERVRLNPGCVA